MKFGKSNKNLPSEENIFPNSEFFNTSTASRLLQNIIHYLDQGYLVYFREKDDLYISNTGKEILGFSRDKIIYYKDFINSIHPDDRKILNETIEQTISEKKAIEITYRLLVTETESGKDGKNINSVIFPYVEGDFKELIVITLKENSRELKQRKDLIRAKEKAEEENHLKSIFLTNISQVIRTPMNSILGFAELLNIGISDQETKKEYVNIIKKQGNDLLNLIDDIAEIAKFETGELAITKTPCNLNAILKELLQSFEHQKSQMNKNQLNLMLKLPEQNEIITYTDEGRLQQVLSNLLNNAIKFTETGSVEFGYTVTEDTKAEFYVKDTGPGLTKEEQRYIFNRFRQIDEANIKKYEGSGLGLTVSRAIVKLLGGKIWVISEPDKGSVFYFTIPLEKIPDENLTENMPVENKNTGIYNWRDKVVLIVEDEEVNYKFLEAVIIGTEAKVLYAKTGHQAIDLCKSINKIDLILMDIKMPEMDGYKTTREIRKFNANVPIIAQTAYALESDREKCLDAGCNELITKPINIADLLNMINSYFVK
jgi:CheY-like chemotaxis protein